MVQSWDTESIHEPVTFGCDSEYDAVISDTEQLNNFYNPFPRKHKIIHADAILPIKDINYMDGWKSRLNEHASRLSVLIANPPWRANVKYSREYLQKYGYTLAQGQFDSYDFC